MSDPKLIQTWQVGLLFCTRAAAVAKTSSPPSPPLLAAGDAASSLSGKEMALIFGGSCLPFGGERQRFGSVSEPPAASAGDGRAAASARPGSQVLQCRRRPSGCGPSEDGSADGLMEIIPVGNVLVQ